MGIHQVTTVWSGGTVLTAKRQAQSLAEWAVEHVGEVLGGQSSTASTSGSGQYWTTTVGWTLDSTHYESQVETWGTRAEHDSAVEAVRQAIRDAGGTLDP